VRSTDLSNLTSNPTSIRFYIRVRSPSGSKVIKSPDPTIWLTALTTKTTMMIKWSLAQKDNKIGREVGTKLGGICYICPINYLSTATHISSLIDAFFLSCLCFRTSAVITLSSIFLEHKYLVAWCLIYSSYIKIRCHPTHYLFVLWKVNKWFI